MGFTAEITEDAEKSRIIGSEAGQKRVLPQRSRRAQRRAIFRSLKQNASGKTKPVRTLAGFTAEIAEGAEKSKILVS
jgi:hypothetical protein